MLASPCKNCRHAIFTDGEDFWKWDHESSQYRMVDFSGVFYPLETHPSTTEQQLVAYIGGKLRLSSDVEIVWRTVNLIFSGLLAAGWLPPS
jgi:hypothetical protein